MRKLIGYFIEGVYLISASGDLIKDLTDLTALYGFFLTGIVLLKIFITFQIKIDDILLFASMGLGYLIFHYLFRGLFRKYFKDRIRLIYRICKSYNQKEKNKRIGFYLLIMSSLFAFLIKVFGDFSSDMSDAGLLYDNSFISKIMNNL